MKFNFSLKNKEASFEADVEKLIDKNIEYKAKNPKNKEPKKTRYQIKQEEKRKNKELEHKQTMEIVKFCCIAFVVLFTFIMIMAFLEG